MFRLPFNPLPLGALLLGSFVVRAQTVEVVPVRAERAGRTLPLPGEILPYQRVEVQSRASGFLETVLVDRGDSVKAGQTLATLTAPELEAATAEAAARVSLAESRRAEAAARLAALRATEERLRKAAETPGAIAGNELVQAAESVAAARAAEQAAAQAVHAAEAAVRASRQAEAYLRVTAPFAGVITERSVHPGALVGPGAGSAGRLFVLEEVARLRVVVAVPESEVVGIRPGASVSFRVPAYPGRVFEGRIARRDRSLDPRTRTLPVELDAANPGLALAPGMYAEVAWPTAGAAASLLVPPTAIVTTTERSFVIRVRDGRAQWVDVRRGPAAGDAVTVVGALAAGDVIVRRATDELRDGARVSAK